MCMVPFPPRPASALLLFSPPPQAPSPANAHRPAPPRGFLLARRSFLPARRLLFLARRVPLLAPQFEAARRPVVLPTLPPRSSAAQPTRPMSQSPPRRYPEPIPEGKSRPARPYCRSPLPRYRPRPEPIPEGEERTGRRPPRRYPEPIPEGGRHPPLRYPAPRRPSAAPPARGTADGPPRYLR